MRNQDLQGYLIHHRKYRERSHIVYLFTEEYGRIDGVLRQTLPPQFHPIYLFATGKSALKNFNKLEVFYQPETLQHDALFCGFYLNELILKLCPLEEKLPKTFAQYALAIKKLQKVQENDLFSIKQILRQFESVLLKELGYELNFNHFDIQPTRYYQFNLHEGFVEVLQSKDGWLGQTILTLENHIESQPFTPNQLKVLGYLYKKMITELLGNRPLNARQLWVNHFNLKNR